MLANFFHNTERSISFFGSCLGSLKFPKKFGEEMVTVLVLIWLFGDHHSQKMDQPQKIGKNSEKTAKNRRNWNWNPDFWPETDKLLPILWPKGPFSPKFVPKIFLSPTDKNWRFYFKKISPPPKKKKKMTFFFGGGDKGYLSTFKERKI